MKRVRPAGDDNGQPVAATTTKTRIQFLWPRIRRFSVEFEDDAGRQYALIRDGPEFRELVERGDISEELDLKAVLARDNISSDIDFGGQMMVWRLPRGQHEVPFHQPAGDKMELTLIYLDTQRVCRISYVSVHWMTKRRSGYMVTRRFVVTTERR